MLPEAGTGVARAAWDCHCETMSARIPVDVAERPADALPTTGREPGEGPRPRLFVSNVAARRPANPRFHRAVSMLSDAFVQAASTAWDVTWAYAEEDGTERTLERARAADAVVILGGEDVSPGLYGGRRGYPGETAHWPRADRAQIELVRSAVRHDTPLLGICRGAQVIAVALGGTLVPDLKAPGHRSANFLEDHRLALHEILVDPSSRLSRAIRTDRGRTVVTSGHHQAVATTGPDLQVVAVAQDGTIEAIEHVSARVAGVQWHPEDPGSDPSELLMLMGLLQKVRARPTHLAA